VDMYSTKSRHVLVLARFETEIRLVQKRKLGISSCSWPLWEIPFYWKEYSTFSVLGTISVVVLLFFRSSGYAIIFLVIKEYSVS